MQTRSLIEKLARPPTAEVLVRERRTPGSSQILDGELWL